MTMEISIPISWILTGLLSLCGTIATLAGIMWSFVKSRIDAQDKIIEAQNSTIGKLQDDVERMSKGCGADHCVWKNR
jgi:hypothetical protein